MGNFKDMQKQLKKQMKPKRFKHTLGVVETAVKLAERYDCNVSDARTAALLHDCAKHLPDEDKIAMCRKYELPITQAELNNPGLLHAKCGAILAETEYGITDQDILHAIMVHTTGVPNMNLLDQIIFTADYIEPGRDQAPHLKELRELSMEDLEETVYRILADTVEYLNQRDLAALDETTQCAYEYYRDLMEERKAEEDEI